MDDKVGTEFKLWGGEIWGKNIKVIPEKYLKQEWHDTPDPKPSIVEFKLKKSGNNTIVDLYHKKVPDESLREIEKGWKVYYLGPLKDLLEQIKY